LDARAIYIVTYCPSACYTSLFERHMHAQTRISAALLAGVLPRCMSHIHKRLRKRPLSRPNLLAHSNWNEVNQSRSLASCHQSFPSYALFSSISLVKVHRSIVRLSIRVFQRIQSVIVTHHIILVLQVTVGVVRKHDDLAVLQRHPRGLAVLDASP
jgi:hypothetical protein